MNGEKFRKIFSDQLNRLDLAYDVLSAALESAYGGEVSMELTHSEAAHTDASVRVKARSISDWGLGWQVWEASGQIEWHTTSGHYVRFEFERPDEYGPIKLKEVVIGDDPSGSFYPSIVDTCNAHGIPVRTVSERGADGG